MTFVRAYAHAMIHTAAAWDVLGACGALPPWWPPVSWVLVCAGIGAGCLAVLLDVLASRRSTRTGRSAADDPARSGARMLALGLLLAAWVLRGDAEIPPDVPLVAAEVVAAALYAVFAGPWVAGWLRIRHYAG